MAYKLIQKVCPNCKKDFLGNPKNKFCSSNCFGANYSKNKTAQRLPFLNDIVRLYSEGNGIDAIARMLHIERGFVRKTLIKNGVRLRTLSECNSIVQRKRSNRLIKQCLNCGENFRSYPSYAKKNRGKFCSVICAKVYPPNRERQRDLAIKQITSNTFRRETMLEKAMRELLESVDTKFVQQFKLGKFIYDFYWPEFNIILEMDGDYWHGNIPKSKWRPFHFKNKRRDREKTRLAKNLGYNLIRVSERAFYKNLPILKEICSEKSEQCIQK